MGEENIMPKVENPIIYYLDEHDKIIFEFQHFNVKILPNVGDIVWLQEFNICRVTQIMHRYNDYGVFSICINVVSNFNTKSAIKNVTK
jgi:hypothetical protein